MIEDIRPRAVDRLPTVEQINEITSVEDLSAIKEEVMAAIKEIEVDLEFRTDDAADGVWEHRARKALAAHQICNTRLGNRIRLLTRGRGPDPQEAMAQSIRKKEAATAKAAAQMELQKGQAVMSKEKTRRAFIEFAERQNFLACFYRPAVETLDREVVNGLVEAARAGFDARYEVEAAKGG